MMAAGEMEQSKLYRFAPVVLGLMQLPALLRESSLRPQDHAQAYTKMQPSLL